MKWKEAILFERSRVADPLSLENLLQVTDMKRTRPTHLVYHRTICRSRSGNSCRATVSELAASRRSTGSRRRSSECTWPPPPCPPESAASAAAARASVSLMPDARAAL